MTQNQKVANLQNALAGAGYVTATPTAGTTWPLNGPYSMGQLTELIDIFKAGNASLKFVPIALPTLSLTPAATLTGTLVITQTLASYLAGKVVQIQVGDNGSDALAITATSGAGSAASPYVILINLANSTDSNNTLVKIKAALDTAPLAGDNSGTSTQATGTALISTAIFGTSTPHNAQLVHGGTNTLAATTLAGGTGQNVAGVAASAFQSSDV